MLDMLEHYKGHTFSQSHWQNWSSKRRMKKKMLTISCASKHPKRTKKKKKEWKIYCIQNVKLCARRTNWGVGTRESARRLLNFFDFRFSSGLSTSKTLFDIIILILTRKSKHNYIKWNCFGVPVHFHSPIAVRHHFTTTNFPCETVFHLKSSQKCHQRKINKRFHGTWVVNCCNLFVCQTCSLAWKSTSTF